MLDIVNNNGKHITKLVKIKRFSRFCFAEKSYCKLLLFHAEIFAVKPLNNSADFKIPKFGAKPVFVLSWQSWVGMIDFLIVSMFGFVCVDKLDILFDFNSKLLHFVIICPYIGMNPHEEKIF